MSADGQRIKHNFTLIFDKRMGEQGNGGDISGQCFYFKNNILAVFDRHCLAHILIIDANIDQSIY